MVLVFLLGALDILAALSLLLLKFFPILEIPTIILAVLVLIKSARYFVDIASAADIVAAIFMIAAATLNYYPLFMYIIVIWFFQKGVRSFI